MSEAALLAVPTSGFWMALPFEVLIIRPPVSWSFSAILAIARSAWTQGCRLLKHPAVRERIAKLEQQRQERRRQDHEAAAADMAIRAGHLRLAQRAMNELLRLRALPEFRPK